MVFIVALFWVQCTEMMLIFIIDEWKKYYLITFLLPWACMSVLTFILGAFLVPYGLFVIIYGIPLFLLETSIGQYTQEGFITCWNKLCPLARGELLCAQIKIPVRKRRETENKTNKNKTKKTTAATSSYSNIYVPELANCHRSSSHTAPKLSMPVTIQLSQLWNVRSEEVPRELEVGVEVEGYAHKQETGVCVLPNHHFLNLTTLLSCLS